MARDPYIERRLDNWARWKRSLTHEGKGTMATCDMSAERVDGDGWDAEQAVPTFDPEASETDDGLRKMTVDLQRTIDAVYLHELPFKRAASKLGVEVVTLHARIQMVHRKLSTWLFERNELRKIERDRVVLLQSSRQRP